MLVREHPELIPWPDHNAISGVPPLPRAQELPRLRILGVRTTNPATIHLTLEYGRGTCAWSKEMKDVEVSIAFRKNRDNLIGKTLQEVGNLDIIPTRQ